MKTLFTTQGSNSHQSLLAIESSKWGPISRHINRHSMAKDWECLEFVFKGFGKTEIKIPDICPVYYTGVIAFRAELKENIFPAPCNELEFLPIKSSGKDWLLLNCLRTTRQYDTQRSEVTRVEGCDIFRIQKLVVTDRSLETCEVFTVEDSNRAQLMAFPSLKKRIEELKLQGLNFSEIGYLV